MLELSLSTRCTQPDFGQSIRTQQSKKRNLAEQAFTLSRRNNDWIGVSGSMDVIYLLF